MTKFLNIITCSFLFQMVYGALLFDVPVELNQPNGETLSCFASGDEFYNRLHDNDGYTIVQSNIDGFYYYATLNSGQIVPSSYRADIFHNLESLGIEKDIMIPREQYQQKRERKLNGVEMRDAPTIGTVNNLNVFIRFSDEQEFALARSYYDGYFNDPEGPSMLHYFKEVSYEMLTVNTIHYPTSEMTTNLSYQDEHPRSYYQPYNEVTNPNGYANDNEAGMREQTLLFNAIAFIEDEVPDTLDIDANDDGYVDNMTFLVSGSPGAWASLLWPHRWALYLVEAYIDGKRVWDYNFNLSSGPYFSVGTLCHEFAHSLGAPDLYHYWDAYSPVAVGGWDVMDASTDIPQYPSSYIKYRYFDWIELEDASGGGTFSLDPVTSPHNCAYKLDSSNPMEYFVLEYRTQEGMYDTYAPGIDQGVVIYRVNDVYNGQGNANGPPDELYVYRVGGTPSSSGSFGAAVFNSLVGRTEFNDNTDPSSFLSDGSAAGINIVDIGEPGDTIEFTVLNLMLLGNFMGVSHDLDGDGVINPGESILLEFEMNNMSDDIFASSITGNLSSDSDIIFPYPEIDFGELGPGNSTTPYLVEAVVGENIELGDALITMNITASYQQGGEVVEYDGNYSFSINVSLNQSGFPYEISFPISSSPIEINIDSHPDNELVFGDYDGFVRAFKSNGAEVVNEIYPYETGNQIWGSPASADIDLDGIIDYVIASKDKNVYLLDQNGFKDSTDLGTFLLGTPTIGNIDADDELELILGGYSSSGEKIYALNHDLTPVTGFPVDIGEKIKMGVSLADFNENGMEDIVFGTNDDNIYLLLDDGTIAEGFPFQAGNKIHSSPAILNLDDELIILAGSNDDFLYAINSDGSLRFSVQASDAVEGSPSFLNFMNQCYIFFGDKSGMVYGIDTEGNMLPNFPFDGGSQIIGSIVFSDLNNDTFPEIIFGTDSGEMYVINLDGELYPQMPITFPFPYYSSPLISDIDEDGDMEIIAGTSLSINAYDIKQPGNNDGYWSMYKGNNKRTGVHQFSQPCAMGDINGDQNVDVMDIVQLVNIIIGDITPTTEEVCASDVNYDTEINLLDVIVLLNTILDY